MIGILHIWQVSISSGKLTLWLELQYALKRDPRSS